MAGTINPSDLAGAVNEILSGYAQEITEAVKEEAQDVAKAAVKEIRASARRLFKSHSTSAYASSWRQKVIEENSQGLTVVVYSRKYQLAHLLEHGHAVVRKGAVVGRAPAYPHIAPAEENASAELQRRIKIRISGRAS